jgi:histidine triad (HIT) family protein
LGKIELPHFEPCPFCDYLSGKRPYTILWKGFEVAILVTREQRGKAHVLVMPVEHRETIQDITDAEAKILMIAIRQVSKAILAITNSAGISVWQNNGTMANQAIPHVHFHVAGTLDDGVTERGEVPEITISETDRISEDLRRELEIS